MKSLLIFFTFILTIESTYGQVTVSTKGNKYALLEATHSVSTMYTPDGDVFIDKVKQNVNKAICIVYHNGWSSYPDAMKTPYIEPLISAYYNGYPSGYTDRALTTAGGINFYISRANYIAALNERLALPPVYDLTMSYTFDTISQTYAIHLHGKALANITDSVNFNVCIVEDSVIGIGPQYNQVNYYDTVVGHPYYGRGNPVFGYVHMNVVRDLLGGTWGVFAKSNSAIGDTLSRTFYYTLPSAYKLKNIRVIGMVMKYDSSNKKNREILNAIQIPQLCPAPENIQVCAISVDSISGKNQIVWDKSGIQYAAVFNVYKETTVGQYALIGTHPINLPPSYIDMSSDPSIKSEKYKITIIDSCAKERSLDSCMAHKMIHLTSFVNFNGDVVLNWSSYEGIGYGSVDIVRSLNGGPYLSVAQMPASTTSFSDTDSKSSNKSYKIEIQAPSNCLINKINSNTVYTFPTNIDVTNGKQLIRLYPNPVSETFYISNIKAGDKVILFDLTGRKLNTWEGELQNRSFDVKGIATGTYLIQVYNEAGLHKANLRLDHK